MKRKFFLLFFGTYAVSPPVFSLSDGHCKSGLWTRWFDRDDPSGRMDNEERHHFSETGAICEHVTGVQARLLGDENTDFTTDQEVELSVDGGFICRNSQNKGGCKDYEVRFCCAELKSRCPKTNVGETMEIFELQGTMGHDLDNLPQCTNKDDGKPDCDYHGCMHMCYTSPDCKVVGWSQNGNCYLKTDAASWHSKGDECDQKNCFVGVKCNFQPTNKPPVYSDHLYVGEQSLDKQTETTLTRGESQGHIHLFPQFRIHFKFKPDDTDDDTNEWKSIIHLTDDQGGHPQRVLGLWFKPNSFDMRLQFEMNNQGGTDFQSYPQILDLFNIDYFSEITIAQNFVASTENYDMLLISEAVEHPHVNGLYKREDYTNADMVVFKHVSRSLFLHRHEGKCCHGNWHINSEIEGGTWFYWTGKSDDFMGNDNWKVIGTNTISNLTIQTGDFELEWKVKQMDSVRSITTRRKNRAPIEFDFVNVYHGNYFPVSGGKISGLEISSTENSKIQVTSGRDYGDLKCPPNAQLKHRNGEEECVCSYGYKMEGFNCVPYVDSFEFYICPVGDSKMAKMKDVKSVGLSTVGGLFSEGVTEHGLIHFALKNGAKNGFMSGKRQEVPKRVLWTINRDSPDTDRAVCQNQLDCNKAGILSTDYMGEISYTRSGRTCQVWTSQTPHKHDRLPINYQGKGLGTHNSCRNPDSEIGAWCYTTDPNVRWEYCACQNKPSRINDQCHEGANSFITNDPSYRGKMATTISGRLCQNWKSQSPHDHGFSADDAAYGIGDHNYCRNPDGGDGAWCYTTDPDVRWEYCSCDKKDEKIFTWHGESDVATYDFIGGFREFHGPKEAIFDNLYSNNNMYHSLEGASRRGVVITFVKPVKFVDILIYTRSYCCRERYGDVCLYADGEQFICTPSDIGDPGLTISFKDYKMSDKVIIGSRFEIVWDRVETGHAQIEELFFDYTEFKDPCMVDNGGCGATEICSMADNGAASCSADPCATIKCPTESTCVRDDSGAASCICDNSMHVVASGACVDPCSLMMCNANSQCKNVDGVASCVCMDGFTMQDNICVKEPNVWHGETDIATYDFIGGYREWHGGRDAMFDNGYNNREMYHSTTCEDDRGVVIKFKEPIEYIDVKIFTRSYCCRDPRYNGVCLYADGNKIACTPSDLGDPGLTINFKDYNLVSTPTVAREFAIMWDQKGSSCAQIEELFFHYYDSDENPIEPENPCETNNPCGPKQRCKVIRGKAKCELKIHPVEKLDKIWARFSQWMADNFSSHPNFITAIKKKATKQADMMTDRFNNLVTKCDTWDELIMEEEPDDAQRFDRENPCKAALQLPSAFMKWSAEFNTHCKKQKESEKFIGRIDAAFVKIQKKFQKKLGNC